MNKFWIVKQQAKSPGTVELYIYGDIEGDGVDWWTGEKIESDTSADHIRKEIEAFGDVRTVELHINSMGGSVFEANAIVNYLRRLKADTIAYVDAFACSAASAIACACDMVVMPRNSVMMIHNPWTVAIGNAKELRKAADDLDVLSEAFATVYIDKADGKLDEKRLTKLLDDETYLTAEQAYDLGLCDEVEQFDAVMQEPDSAAKAAAKARHIDLGKIAAMVRGEAKPDEEKTPEPEPTPEPKEPEPTPEPEPETTEKSEQKSAERVNALINKIFM